jgi:HD-like signal output (HDOD) protein
VTLPSSSDDLQAIGQFLRQVKKLHSPPQVAQRLLNLTYDLQFDVYEVMDCLKNDPALAARILQVVNSSSYGLRAGVSSLQQAISHLGQRSLRLITLTFTIVNALTRGTTGEVYQPFWKRALTMAALASQMAEHCQEIDSESARTSGLLADLGVLLMAQAASESYTSLYRQKAHGPELVAAERERYGFGHPALAARLLELWEFPAPVVQAVLHHHDAQSRPLPLESVVALSNYLVDVLWEGSSGQLAAARRALQQSFGLDTDGFINLVLACKEELAETAQLFDVSVNDTLDVQRLLEQAQEQYQAAALETALELDSLLSVFHEHTVAKPA